MPPGKLVTLSSQVGQLDALASLILSNNALVLTRCLFFFCLSFSPTTITPTLTLTLALTLTLRWAFRKPLEIANNSECLR